MCAVFVFLAKLYRRSTGESSLKELTGQSRRENKYAKRSTAKCDRASGGGGGRGVPPSWEQAHYWKTYYSDFTAGLPEGKGLPWLTFGSSIKSSDSGISIYKKTSTAITIFSRTGLIKAQVREHAKRQARKKPGRHAALLLSSPTQLWPSAAGKGVFSGWLGCDGSDPKVRWRSVLSNLL